MGTMIHTSERNTATWVSARLRVEALLSLYRIPDDSTREKLVAEIMAEAEHSLESDSVRQPDEIAVEATLRRVHVWIDQLLGPSNEQAAERSARGRVAILLADLPGKFPHLMLNATAVPDDLLTTVRTIYLEAGPDLSFGNMGPRPIDLGPVSSVADGTWRTFDRWPVLRGAFLAALFLSLLGTALYLVRF